MPATTSATPATAPTRRRSPGRGICTETSRTPERKIRRNRTSHRRWPARPVIASRFRTALLLAPRVTFARRGAASRSQIRRAFAIASAAKAPRGISEETSAASAKRHSSQRPGNTALGREGISGASSSSAGEGAPP